LAVGAAEKTTTPNCHIVCNFLGWFFQLFEGQKKIYIYILASALKS
jgi:hypothetical protein